MGWTGISTRSDPTGAEVVEIDPTFAQSLGLEPKTKVSIKIHYASNDTYSSDNTVPMAYTVHLEPQSSSDWEIVELHAQYLESRMLNQVRAISLNQPVVVFPSATSVAYLNVLKVEPPIPEEGVQFAKLFTQSEVIIAPKVRKKPKEKSTTGNRSVSASTARKRREAQGPCILLRGISLPHPSYPVEISSIKDYQVVLSASEMEKLNNPIHISVSVVNPKVLSKRNDSGVSSPLDGTPGNQQPGNSGAAMNEGSPADDDSGEIVFHSRKIIARVTLYENGLQDHVGLSHSLSSALGITESVGNIIRIELAPKALSNPPSTLVIRPFSTSSSSKSGLTSSSLKIGKKDGEQEEIKKQEENKKSRHLEELKRILNDDFKILQGPITGNMRLPPIEEYLPNGGVLQIKSAEGWILPSKLKTSMTIDLGTNLLRAESTIGKPLNSLLKSTYNTLKSVKSSTIIKEDRTPQVVGIDKTLNEINDALESGFSIGGLIYGSRGSGKTAVLHTIKRKLYENCVYTVFVSCGPKSEDPVGSLKELFNRVLIEASWFAPSVVLFDDLDELMPAEVEHADSTKTRQLAEIFQQYVHSTMSSRSVSILATSKSKESIHAHLFSSHVLDESFHLKSPDKEVRRAILQEAISFLNMEVDDSLDILDIAGSTEGYQPGDLWTLVERVKHESIIRRVENSMAEINNSGSSNALTTASPSSGNIITQDDFDNGLKGFIPASLRGVKLQKSSVSWKEIGGLKETKRILLETLEWPTRYAPIFAKSPLRLRSGLLLYGYPGCGKTLLASAVASESGLNFISVKGPEILNKYIGASEQSVRDLFERAQAAKPCILFFDEFDSIAPKRGHDSTGVTDRVVNQMLTQMDGAEGLDGVYVLAATSRPDLIDSALLRPGRLDKSMICDMPNYEDRLDILNAVQYAGGMVLDDEVSLSDIAKKTEGYSGADLQAVLYNAYLEAIHDLVDIPEAEEETEVNENNNDEEQVEFFHLKSDTINKTDINEIAKSRQLIIEKAKLKKTMEAFKTNSGINQTTMLEIKEDESKDEAPKVHAKIKTSHILKSLEETQPSISLNERLKLQAIYDQFVSGRSGDMPNGENSTEIGGRTTLM